MARAVTIRVRDNGTFMWLKNLPKRTKRIGNLDAWNLAQKGAKEIIGSAREKPGEIKDFTGKLLHGGIKPIKIKKGEYGIEIPLYGLALDRMKPHWVSLKPGRKITRWAKSKRIYARAIRVHRHPYVNRGYRRMLRHANIIVNRMADKIVRG